MLTGLQKKYNAERVVVELNGMHLASDFYLKTPDHWKIAQEVMFADATTFLSYNANMRQLVVDKLAGAEMLVLNRMTPGADVMPYHKIARAVNRRIEMIERRDSAVYKIALDVQLVQRESVKELRAAEQAAILRG